MFRLLHVTRALSITTPTTASHQPESEVSPWLNRVEEAGNRDVYADNTIPVCIEVIKITSKNRTIFWELIAEDL